MLESTGLYSFSVTYYAKAKFLRLFSISVVM